MPIVLSSDGCLEGGLRLIDWRVPAARHRPARPTVHPALSTLPILHLALLSTSWA